jgi:hypothetical protein
MALDPVDTLVLRRAGAVSVPPAGGAAGVGPNAVGALEADLLALGAILSAELRDRLAQTPAADFDPLADDLLAALADQLGADRPHVPLFRRFPVSTPTDTDELFVARVLHWWLQNPEQPCVRCGSQTAVQPVRPCAHLVCHECWDMTDYSGCPICHRRIELAEEEPFFGIEPISLAGGGVMQRLIRRFRGVADPAPAPAVTALSAGRLTRLVATEQTLQPGRDLLARLLARTSPPSPQDRDDLAVLVQAYAHDDELWDAATITVRETAALVLAGLLRRVGPRRGAALLGCHVTVPTDVLRVVLALQAGDPGLTSMPERRSSIARPLRRILLDQLESFGADRLVEDVLARRELWKRALRGLHPFAEHRRRPALACAMAAARETRLDRDDPLARSVRRTVHGSQALSIEGGRVVFRGWSSDVEDALRRAHVPDAVTLLRRRPGVLLRRLDHLLRLALDGDDPRDIDAITGAVAATIARMASPALLTVLVHLHHRHRAFQRRVFFPKGDLALAWAAGDERRPLPSDAILPITDLIEGELLRRAGSGDEAGEAGEALIDWALRDVPVPVAARSSSRALVELPRGTRLALPEAEPLRLFVHWMESDRRVDLDLSVSAYDSEWWFVGQCDYTHLRLGDGATHSGDLTSAPPPLGASEFVDLHFDELERLGARHLVLVVFSYNDVAFDDMADAFAGFMAAPAAAVPFDPAAVLQRFDLRGKARIAIPMVVDLERRTMLWTDVNLTAHGRLHSVGGYRAGLALLGSQLGAAFVHRPTLWDLGCMLAAARHRRVVVRDGSAMRAVERRDDETTLAFARRLRDTPATGPDTASAQPALAVLLDDDLELPAGCSAFALRPQRHQRGVEQLTAGDLLAALSP